MPTGNFISNELQMNLDPVIKYSTANAKSFSQDIFLSKTRKIINMLNLEHVLLDQSIFGIF